MWAQARLPPLPSFSLASELATEICDLLGLQGYEQRSLSFDRVSGYVTSVGQGLDIGDLAGASDARSAHAVAQGHRAA